MTDAPESPPPREATPLAETLIKWGTVAAGLIAAAQAGTTWINGYFGERNANIAAQQNVELQKVKDQSELARTYLDLILSDQTTPQDRTLLYDALSQLKDHPLQAWAKQRYETNRLYVVALAKNAQERAEAARIKEESQRESTELKLEADAITLEMNKAQADGDGGKVEELREKILMIYTRISETEAVVSVATITIEKSVSDQSVGSKLPELNALGERRDTVVALSEKITPDLLKPLFAASASESIEDNYIYLQKALQEFRVSDPRIVAAIVANLAVESPNLREQEENEAFAARMYQGKIGNTEPGDGAKYRGRGYMSLTGRANYVRMADRLGLPSLVDFPEDAKKPELALRITVALVTERATRLTAALDADDLIAASKVFRGSAPPAIHERFAAAYQKAIAALST